MSKIKHSKFKNTGILFELLVRQVTADILDDTNVQKANGILQKFFNESTELGKELKLYQLLVQEKAKDSVGADRVIETILKARKRISGQKLCEQKYNLIKEIKENYPLGDFLKGNISNYKLFASIYKLFEDSTSNQQHDLTEVIQSRNFVTESLLGNSSIPTTKEDKDRLIEHYKRQEEDLRILAYKILVDKFNSKYSSLLNEQQKLLLKEYINNVSNTNSLKKFMDTEVPKVQAELKLLGESLKDTVVKIKLVETIRQLDRVKKGSTVKDSQVTSLLQSYELIKELKSVSSKSNG
jgi:hypothetical protein